MIKATINTLLVASALTVSSLASAASCNDIQLKDKYADLKQFCTKVIDKKGAEWAHLEAKVVQTGSNKLKVKFMQQDGEYSNTFKSKDLPDSFRTYINGKETKVRDLKSGQKLDFFIKAE